LEHHKFEKEEEKKPPISERAFGKVGAMSNFSHVRPHRRAFTLHFGL
jgi:hypothetical protein